MIKAFSVRLDEYIYNRLSLLAKENNLSLNKMINSLLLESLDKSKELNSIELIGNSLLEIEKMLTSLSKKHTLHFKITSQLFANHGYLSNAAVDEDKSLNEVLYANKKFYD